MNHRRAVGVDLLTQVGDVELDDVRLATEIVVPDSVEDLGLAEHSPWVAHEVSEQLELGRGQLNLYAAALYFMAVLVECQITDYQRRVAPASAAPLRRRSARSRAITSSRLNGLVT